MIGLSSSCRSKRKKSRLFLFSIIIFLIGGLFTPSPSYSKVYIDINAPELHRFPISVQDFQNLGSGKSVGSKDAGEDIGAAIGKILRNDFEISGLFYVLDPLVYLEEPGDAGIKIGQFDFEDWTLIGTEALVKGGYEIYGKNGQNLLLEARLFDVFQMKLIYGVRYKGRTSDLRLMAHKLADTIIEKLAGQKGIFQTKIAFISPGKKFNDLYIMDIDGHNVARIISNNSVNIFPSWAPRGDGILFTSYSSGDPEIYLRWLRNRTPVQLTNKNGLDYGAVWNPQRNAIAFAASFEGNSEIYRINFNKPEKLTRLTRNWSIDIMPSWSPDGKKIAFVSDRSGNPQIYTMNHDGTGVKRLTYHGKYNTSPSWSPAGDKIAFVTQERNNNLNIYAIDPDGTNLMQLTGGPGDEERPTWSPDGRILAFSSSIDGKKAIYILQFKGNKAPIRISPPDLPASQPSWSPYLK